MTGRAWFPVFAVPALLSGCVPDLEAQSSGSEGTLGKADGEDLERRGYRDTVTCWGDEYRAIDLSPLSRLRIGPGAWDLDERLLRPFFSDGCSSAPDGWGRDPDASWQGCCVVHDTRYWLGGTEAEKRQADDALERCIADEGFPTTASVYAAAVEAFGGPNTFQLYRWGFGWNGTRAYGPLSQRERAQVVAIYGVEGDELSWLLASGDAPLERVCDPYDPAFNATSPEELVAYAYLRAWLPRPDVVDWARWGYFNLAYRELEIQLMDCPDRLTFRFDRDQATLLSVTKVCGLP